MNVQLIINTLNETQTQIDKFKKRHFCDTDLDIIWKYLIDIELPEKFPHRNFSHFLMACELQHDEYGYCVERIFGKKSYDDYIKNTDPITWNNYKYVLEGNEKRNPDKDIVKIYEKRGNYRYSNIDYRKTDKEKEMFNPDFSINDKYKKKAKLLLNAT